MELFQFNFDVVFLGITCLIFPLWVVYIFGRSYLIGLVLIALGFLIVGLNIVVGSAFDYFALKKCGINDILYLTLDWRCGRRIVFGYGLIFAGLISVLLQFISETFLHGNKQ